MCVCVCVCVCVGGQIMRDITERVCVCVCVCVCVVWQIMRDITERVCVCVCVPVCVCGVADNGRHKGGAVGRSAGVRGDSRAAPSATEPYNSLRGGQNAVLYMCM